MTGHHRRAIICTGFGAFLGAALGTWLGLVKFAAIMAKMEWVNWRQLQNVAEIAVMGTALFGSMGFLVAMLAEHRRAKGQPPSDSRPPGLN